MSKEMFEKGIEAFAKFLYAQTGKEAALNDMRIVWQVKCLQNHKYIITNIAIPGYIAELTYDGDKGKLYVDCYGKMWQDIIKEKEESK